MRLYKHKGINGNNYYSTNKDFYGKQQVYKFKNDDKPKDSVNWDKLVDLVAEYICESHEDTI